MPENRPPEIFVREKMPLARIASAFIFLCLGFMLYEAPVLDAGLFDWLAYTLGFGVVLGFVTLFVAALFSDHDLSSTQLLERWSTIMFLVGAFFWLLFILSAAVSAG